MAKAVGEERVGTYIIEGIDCADCARRVEEALRREPGLEQATVSFATGTVLLPPEGLERAREILARVEPGARIVVPAADAPMTPGGTQNQAGHATAAGPAGRAAAGELARRVAEIITATLLFLAGTFLHPRAHGTPLAAGVDILLLAVYAWTGRGVLGRAARNARHGRFFDENFLMTVATAGAIALHELPEAVAVMLFYSVGEFFQDLAVQRSRRSIRALVDLRPDFARVRRGGAVAIVPPRTVAVGEEIEVRPGERIPLDGIVVEGDSFVDTSALTGEPVPRRVAPGDEVLAGTVNTRGVLVVRVTRPMEQSSATRILHLIESAAARKAPAERFITTFARFYTPLVVGTALAVALLPPLVLPGATLGEWARRALVLLVISCPCALVVSIPLGYFAGLGAASRRGVLVKGAHFLDALARLETVVWDKTGTLTRGTFEVLEVTVYNGFSRERVLELAAHAEAFSGHPIAAAIARAYGRPVDESRVSAYQEVAGCGALARVDGRPVIAGNERLLDREGIRLEGGDSEAGGTVVFVAVDGVLAGRIVIADEIKPASAEAVTALRACGVRRHVMLTGDRGPVAERVARALGLDEVHAGLLPEDKVALLERMKAARRRHPGRAGTLAFVGDGLNDAPVLARADIGVAMGGLGSEAAIEAADVVIMDDNPAKLAAAVSVARGTRRVVQQNIALALGVKLLFVLLGTAGVASMWEAVFADVGVSLLAILNAMRVLRAR
ncbi:MAG TPA: heavy metal translocating P-type ATPase [Thermaerobacter sp.]